MYYCTFKCENCGNVHVDYSNPCNRPNVAIVTSCKKCKHFLEELENSEHYLEHEVHMAKKNYEEKLKKYEDFINKKPKET